MPTLDWIGKQAVVNHQRQVPFHLLRRVPELSVGDLGNGNLLVEGDNLTALKALLPYYAGKIKCIYIDPPYNTGNENWVYNDNVNAPIMRDWLGKVVGKEAEDLSRHDKWLCMMYPRISLLHKFLREDGVLIVSIDDHELANLGLLLKEIFGENNLIATLVWEKGKKGDAKFFSVTHEYVIVAAKSKTTLIERNTKWRKRKEGIDEALENYRLLRERQASNHEIIRQEMMRWYRSLPKGHPAKNHKHYNWSDDRGLYFPDNFHGPDDGRESRPRYDIIHPVTGRPCAKPSTGWRWDEERTKRALAEDPARIHFGPDENTIPCRKSYLAEVTEEPFQSVFYKDGRAATLELEQMVGPGKFAFPKDSEVLAELIDLVCEKDDFILDSFAGTGTTGHAILKLNLRDGGHRRFILVELEEMICREVAWERLKKAIEGYVPFRRRGRGRDEPVPGMGGSFSYVRLDLSLFDETGNIRPQVKFDDLAAHVYFTETGEPLPETASGESPLIGVHNGTAVYLLYNGVLADKKANGGNVLTRAVLASLQPHFGAKVIYGTGCRLGEERLRRENIKFRQIPYQVIKVD